MYIWAPVRIPTSRQMDPCLHHYSRLGMDLHVHLRVCAGLDPNLAMEQDPSLRKPSVTGCGDGERLPGSALEDGGIRGREVGDHFGDRGAQGVEIGGGEFLLR